MTLLDANVLMYAVGREHPHKAVSARLLEQIGAGDREAAIDAEVLQEILHRYRSLGRWPEGVEIYRNARLLFERPLVITSEVMDQTVVLMERYAFLTTRDAVHAAVVQVYGLESICSFDRDFDRIVSLKRIEP